MSEVISFRLNPDNPREAQALEILRTKQAEGFSSRRVLTDALIAMVAKRDREALFSLEEFNDAIEQVSFLLNRLKSEDQIQGRSTHPQVVSLNSNFLNSVKVAAKPGIKLDEG